MSSFRGRILGLGQTTLYARAGFDPVCEALKQGRATYGAEPPLSAVVRVWWRISSVLTPGIVTPRVRIAWGANDAESRGALLNPETSLVSDPASANQAPSLICDAWYGQIEIPGCTSTSVKVGRLEEDGTPDGQYVVQATITEGGTGAAQYATFTRPVTIAGGGGGNVDIYIPGADAGLNNGASRCVGFSWLGTSATVVTIRADDFGGTPVQALSTGALLAPGFSDVPRFVLAPNVWRLNVSSVAPVTGRVLFFYY